MQKTGIDANYLVVGHVTRDLVPGGYTIGGTVTYASLCAAALGKKPAIITSCADDLELTPIDQFPITIIHTDRSTTFENIETPTGRKQILHEIAPVIFAKDIPSAYKHSEIVHLGPVADEINPDIIVAFPQSFIGLTPQGWMRKRNEVNEVVFKRWDSANTLLQRADAVVLSIEDIFGNENLIKAYSEKSKVLAITEGYNGASIYWNGDVRHFSAPKVNAINATGAGDIFAAVFFCVLYKTKDPWEAGRQAVRIATASVTRIGIESVPTTKEMRTFQIEIVEGK